MKKFNPVPQASNLETIINSIKYDAQVYYWFASLLMHPRVQNELTADDPELIRSFRMARITRRLSALMSVVGLILFFFYLKTNDPGYLAGIIIALVTGLGCHYKNKAMIVLLGRRLLTRTYPGDTICSHTLYQVAERYGRDYHIPSLVDVIYHWDRILRRTMMAGLLLILPELTQFQLLELVGYFFGIWVVTNIVIRSLILCRCLRSETSPAQDSFSLSVGLLNANLILVFVATFLEVNVLGWGGLVVLAQAVMKIVFYSGVFGLLVELVSGQSLVISWDRFKRNVKEYWLAYALITFVPLTILMILFFYFPIQPAQLRLMGLLLTMVTSALMLLLVIAKKYLKPLGLGRRKITVGGRDALILVLLGACWLGAGSMPLLMKMASPHFFIVILFIRAYVFLLAVLYLARLIVLQYPEIRQPFTFERELYLINPIEGGGVFYHWAMQVLLRDNPSVMTILSALTPARYHIRVFNRVEWHPSYFAAGKLVGITCSMTNNSHEAYALAKEFRRRGSTVIMGGLHVQAFPEEALEYCDSVVLGEAEGIWPQVIADYENHRLQREYYPHEDPDAYQIIHHYQKNLPACQIKGCIETTRGCKYNCYFCALHNMKWSSHRKSVDEVVDLVKRFREKGKIFTFLDSNIYSDPEYLKDLFLALRPLNVKWQAASTMELAEDDDLLSLAKEAGCVLLFLGYEIVPGMNKQPQGGKLSMTGRYLELSRRIQKKGIGIRAHYILGFDFQGLRSFWDLFLFNLRLRPTIMALFILTPLPGSPFFNDILPQNRIRTLNWRNYSVGSLVFKSHGIPSVLLRQPFYFLYMIFMFIVTTRFGWIVGVLLLLNALAIGAQVLPK